MTSKYDYVIIGSGFSGLYMAKLLIETNGKNKKILVLEKQNTFGGNYKSILFKNNGKMYSFNHNSFKGLSDNSIFFKSFFKKKH